MPKQVPSNIDTNLQRHRWVIRGQVQGVGFRPFVYRLARELHLTGWVSNDRGGLTLEVQGRPEDIADFAKRLRMQAPPLARVDQAVESSVEPCLDESDFHIQASDHSGPPMAAITPDTALCLDCQEELFGPDNRRYGHALITCTNCGPRYSIIHQIPYDRPATTMANFEMCPACAREYEDPMDRRFHAQPIACRDCGPVLELVDAFGNLIAGDPIEQAVARLRAGEILAIKGLGGFHLAVRADDAHAVARLRRLKHRDAKPFALMCRSVAVAQRLVDMGDEAVAALTSPAAPIILARRRAGAPVAGEVAPANGRLGVMLPYTPIHHLLLAGLTRPESPAVEVLVMTSGNISDEPLVIDNGEAVERLGPLCDAILRHNRVIARGVDDSVLLDLGAGQPPLPIRRSRGYVPAPMALAGSAGVEALCLGGELKNTVTLITSSAAIVSEHLGDLRHPMAFAYYRRAIDDLCRLHQAQPQFIGHDLHPMYVSTQYAVKLARRWNIPAYPIQHHHAHAAAVLAEHGYCDPALAVIWDGSGLGSDGTGWGGELLLVKPTDFQRLAALSPLQLPGGDMAATDIRRSALALLWQSLGEAGEEHPLARQVMPDQVERRTMFLMLRRNLQCVSSSSTGRIFDGLAALLNLCTYNRFEAEAAMALEKAAMQAGDHIHTTETLWQTRTDEQGVQRLDLSPLWQVLLARQLRGESAGVTAAMFHHQLAAAWEAVTAQQAQSTGVKVVVLSGGVMANELLSTALTQRLTQRGLRVLRHQRVPANDGGLSLGQAFIATHRWRESHAEQLMPKECQSCV